MLPGITPALFSKAGPPARKTIFLTAGSTWTVPADWTSTNNKIEALGGGGGGSRSNSGGTLEAGGAGGAAYAALFNIALTPGAVLNAQIGTGGAGANAGNSYTNTDGTDSWLRIDGGSGAPTTIAEGILAKAGLKGLTGGGGAGGTAAASIGAAKNDGGAGGTGVSSYVSGTGGGGAGGPNGVGAVGGKMSNGGNCGSGGGGGANGGAIGSAGSSAGGGGGGNNRSGTGGGTGQTSTINSTAGLNGGGGGGGIIGGLTNPGQGRDGGTDGIWTQTSDSAIAGPGGGGGGGVGTTYIGGNGGLYGGGGSGAGFSGSGTSNVAGNGAPGIIAITYGGAPLPLPPQAFPVVQTTSIGADSVSGLTRVANLPTGIAVGDTLLLFVNGSGSNSPTVPGWTNISDFLGGSAARLTILWRVADGTEGASVTITTQTSIGIAWQIYRISGGGSAAPQVGAGAGGTTVNPDPPICTPTTVGGPRNVLWIAAEAHGYAAVTSAGPAGFTGFQNVQSSSGSRGIATAYLASQASSMDPGIFTNGNASANGWSAQTVAVFL